MQPLDTFSFPLQGPALIEASAGTGKTYTIVNLYLRLLLGHHCQPLSVEQILVVTFTNAATAELKDRIRQKLQQSYLDFYAAHSDDSFVQQLLERLSDRELACKRLALALKQLDQAAIFTIHSFCQRMLSEHAFESGVLYEQTLILDELPYLQIATEDYWRREIVTLEPEVLKRVLAMWRTPDALLKTIRPWLSRRAEAMRHVSVSEVSRMLADYQQQVAAAKSWWLEQDVARHLFEANLRANVRLAKAEFLEQMNAFCRSQQVEPDFDKKFWENFLPEKVAKAAKKDSKDLSFLDFSRFEQLQALQEACNNGLQQAFSQAALHAVSLNVQQYKNNLAVLAPDDLLRSLASALHDNSGQTAGGLASRIRQCFPAALIDEFQDTDPQQFAIFRAIYSPQTDTAVPQLVAQSAQTQATSWIMIGDPKQAIYAFRGADIFTYIQAKQLVAPERQFTLSNNYRSRRQLVEAVNSVFTQRDKAFLVSDSIPFIPVSAAKERRGLEIDQQTQHSLEFAHLPSGELPILSWDSAGKAMAQDCAGQIARLLQLATQGRATIDGKPIEAADCCVLVRDRMEADLVKQALANLNVASVFLVRKSVFSSQTAYDLYLLLQALAHPGSETKLRAALMTELFAFDAAELDALFANELLWQHYSEQVFSWHKDWSKQGLMLVLHQVCQQFNVYEKLISHYADGMRRLSDLRHLIELLQQQSAVVSGSSQLLHWFEHKLVEPDDNHEAQQLRLETDQNLVQIITQHAAKGLEFPLVFLPFVSRYREAKEAIFHDDQQVLLVDFLAENETLAKADHERLAEDIRLLYVALTRAVYFCSVGLWNVSSGRGKSSGFSQTAIGVLLWHDYTQINDEAIVERLSQLSASSALEPNNTAGLHTIGYRQVDQTSVYPRFVDPKAQTMPVWHEKPVIQPIKRSWQLTSYSAISKAHHSKDLLPPGFDEGETSPAAAPINEQLRDLSPSPFTFVKGANAGSFLHAVLESVDFCQPDNLAEQIAEKSLYYGIEAHWQPMLHTWLLAVLQTPLNAQNTATTAADLSLSRLSKTQIKIEMEFHMPLRKVRASQFNDLLNRFVVQREVHYQFEQLNGMLKGFIDLLFEYKGKFYVADYKSNHLGYEFSDYQGVQLEAAMVEHDYHLQAILYSLALHRWLKQRLSDYDYEQHMGGALYLFLRGMSPQLPANGVYHYKPPRALIVGLDGLFDDKQSLVDKSSDTPLSGHIETSQEQLNLW